MGFFSSDKYTKPGKGIEKDGKQKRPLFRFFEILWRKKYKFIGINLIYVLLNILSPVLVCGIFYVAISLYGAFSGSADWAVNLLESGQISRYFQFMLFFAVFLTSVPIFAVGPLQAGFSYIMKSFVKEEPCFLWHDFITKSRSNRKLAWQVSLINGIAATVLILNFTAYLIISDPKGPYAGVIPGFLLFIVAFVIIALFMILVMMNLYMYNMMVTFKVTLRQLYKNSFILVMMKWLPNLLMLIFEGILIAIPIFLIFTKYFDFIVTLVLYLFITPAFIGFLNNFYIYPTVKKYLIDNPNADKSENGGTDDNAAVAAEEKTSTGRFENGMWIED
ncbi:MAG: hypothetical protein E7384_06390 [Ruminococcaceae bacterium]|nr:hypothetical protein [Oscillospiraceae bacterium]